MHITPTTIRDYDRLAHHHYLGARPATIARAPDGRAAVFAARADSGELAGVLVVSMPTLNGRWRSLAWPGRFDTGRPASDARRIHREVRCITRVVIDPRYRARGLARTLVAHYLANPLTPLTEAITGMADVCPFFEAAGMTPYPLPPTRRTARLTDALLAARLEPWQLLDTRDARRALTDHPWLAREARLWADAAGATRNLKEKPPAQLLAHAASHAARTTTAYAHAA